jgi:UDP-N-acetylmuramyl tripeptide synthase
VYNLLAAASVARLANVGASTFQQVLNDYDPGNGRLQRFVIDDCPAVLNLAKNPTGLNQNISLMLSDERPKAVYVIINDEPNDGRDISWLWDVDFERLVDRQDVCMVLAGGHRANDLQVRLKYAGIAAPVVLQVDAALEQARAQRAASVLYVLTNYSALWPTKAELERRERKDG